MIHPSAPLLGRHTKLICTQPMGASAAAPQAGIFAALYAATRHCQCITAINFLRFLLLFKMMKMIRPFSESPSQAHPATFQIMIMMYQ